MTSAIAALAVRRTHVLLVESSRGWLVRVVMEQALATRGWQQASSPADADVLATCGPAGPELRRAVDRVWEQLPGPRVRLEVGSPGDVLQALDDAASRLLDSEHQRDDARQRPLRPAAATSSEETDTAAAGVPMGHGNMEHGNMNMEHGDMNMEQGNMNMEHMEHGDMNMAPEGIPLAAGADDRDGLEMDQLTVSLGPVLPHWPAGIALRCHLNGDVIVNADAVVLDGHTHSAEPEFRAARYCDNAVALISLAGWPEGAARARRIRDSLLQQHDPELVLTAIVQLKRRTQRSRLLRWSLRGLGSLDAQQLASYGLAPHLLGDTYDRLLTMLELAESTVRDGRDEVDAPPTPVGIVPTLVTGLDLAAARLVIASLGVAASATETVHHHG